MLGVGRKPVAGGCSVPVAKWRRSCREMELRPTEEMIKAEGQICFRLI